MSLIGIGQTINNQDVGKLPIQWKNLNTSQCEFNHSSDGWSPEWIPWKERNDGFFIQLFSISPLWYPMYGIVICVILGLILSFIATLMAGRNLNPPLPSKMFNPMMMKFLKWFCPGELVRLQIEFTKEELLGNGNISQ
jgi:hypothetical protein